jgi:hypothetical protein
MTVFNLLIYLLVIINELLLVIINSIDNNF